ncbi:MAG: cupredoxin domain-containing protein [Acidimicrobiales bacterium]
MRLLLVLALVGSLAVGCGDTAGGDDPPEAGGCKVAEGGRVTLVADDIRWDTDCLDAEPGELVIEVDNQDDGVAHNVHLPDHPESPATPLEPGPSSQELAVEVEAGAYEYICDIHPNMVGTLTVADAGTEG